MKYVHDIECFGNYFLAVFRAVNTKNYIKFQIWNDDLSELDEFVKFMLEPEVEFIGFNNLFYDAQVIEYIIRASQEGEEITAQTIKAFSDKQISEKWGIWREWDLSSKHVDIYKIWHYDNNARKAGLKDLEFFFREKSIKDLPFTHNALITKETEVEKIIKYCKYDVDITHDHWERTIHKIEHRDNLGSQFDLNGTNMSDSAIGENLLLLRLAEAYNTKPHFLKKKRTKRSKIDIKDVVFDYIEDVPLVKKARSEYFDNIKLTSTNGEFDFKKEKVHELHYKDTEITYGLGGVHGVSTTGKMFNSTDSMVIKSCDVVSEYPNCIIVNNLQPGHFKGNVFAEEYKWFYEERKKYPKSKNLSMNLSLKLALNTVYGKSNSKYSFLFDPLLTATVTVNCQLMMSWLADLLLKIPSTKLLLINTDGLELLIPRHREKEYNEICEAWEEKTGFTLEHDEYESLWIKDVNNYLGKFTSGEVKQKGKYFVTYDTMVKLEEYHKDSSNDIVRVALNKYFLEGTPVEDTINNHNIIHDFCFRVKKQRNFRWLLSNINEADHIVKNELLDDRLLRYYVSKKGETLQKLWISGKKEGTISAVKAKYPIKVAQWLRRADIVRADINAYPDLDREWYINEAKTIIDEIKIK